MPYFNAAGLAATRQAESGNNYTAQSPTSSASGAYQFLNSTWRSFAPQAGVSLSQYPTAASAPPGVQDAVASITPVSNWGGTWAGSGGANAANPAYLTDVAGSGVSDGGGGITINAPDNFSPNAPTNSPTDPLNFNDPVFGGTGGQLSGTPAGGTIFNSPVMGGTGPSLQPGTGVNENIGLQPSTVSDISSWVQAPITAAQNAIGTWFSQASNWFTRGFLILIGVIILLVALWHVSGRPNPQAIMEAAA